MIQNTEARKYYFIIWLILSPLSQSQNRDSKIRVVPFFFPLFVVHLECVIASREASMPWIRCSLFLVVAGEGLYLQCNKGEISQVKQTCPLTLPFCSYLFWVYRTQNQPCFMSCEVYKLHLKYSAWSVPKLAWVDMSAEWVFCSNFCIYNRKCTYTKLRNFLLL